MNRTSQQYNLQELLQLLLTMMTEVTKGISATSSHQFVLVIKHRHIYQGDDPERTWKIIKFDGLCSLINLLQYQDVITFDQHRELENFFNENKPKGLPSTDAYYMINDPYWFTHIKVDYNRALLERIQFLQGLLTKVINDNKQENGPDNQTKLELGD